MILRNYFEMEKHSVIRKTYSPDFIIPLRYIASESTTTTTTMPLKNGNNKNSQAILSKQSYKHTRLLFV